MAWSLVTDLEAPAPVGSIHIYGGVDVPEGYLECDGASLLRSAYPALFAVIGETFGHVDDQHFNLPIIPEA